MKLKDRVWKPGMQVVIEDPTLSMLSLAKHSLRIVLYKALEPLHVVDMLTRGWYHRLVNQHLR
jgi:hypothetical protein